MIFFEARNNLVTVFIRIGDPGFVLTIDYLPRRPLPPLDAVHFTEVVCALTIRIANPLGILIGILIPYLTTQRAELSRATRRPQKANQFANR